MYRLAKFGGTSITLVPNPDASPNGYWNTPIVNNNKLTFLYLPADNKGRMAEYQTASGSILFYPNPDAGTGFWDKPIVYVSKIYFQYMNAQNILQLAFFDGTSVQLIANPTGVLNADYPHNGYTANSIVWNNKLYVQFASLPYRLQVTWLILQPAAEYALAPIPILPVTFLAALINGRWIMAAVLSPI